MGCRSWRLLESQPGQWWAVDEPSGIAYELPPLLGERLWRAHDAVRSPLIDVLSGDWKGEVADLAFVDLCFMGVTARYQSEEEGVISWLEEQHAACVPSLRSSPDVVICIRPEADVHRLHRSLPAPRAGVHVREISEDTWIQASPDVPILPPLQKSPLAGRYCALHGALVLSQFGGLLFLGSQKAGKTTAALLAADAG